MPVLAIVQRALLTARPTIQFRLLVLTQTTPEMSSTACAEGSGLRGMAFSREFLGSLQLGPT